MQMSVPRDSAGRWKEEKAIIELSLVGPLNLNVAAAISRCWKNCSTGSSSKGQPSFIKITQVIFKWIWLYWVSMDSSLNVLFKVFWLWFDRMKRSAPKLPQSEQLTTFRLGCFVQLKTTRLFINGFQWNKRQSISQRPADGKSFGSDPIRSCGGPQIPLNDRGADRWRSSPSVPPTFAVHRTVLRSRSQRLV